MAWSIAGPEFIGAGQQQQQQLQPHLLSSGKFMGASVGGRITSSSSSRAGCSSMLNSCCTQTNLAPYIEQFFSAAFVTTCNCVTSKDPSYMYSKSVLLFQYLVPL
jgi:hypothetical protein